ncbi:short-chain dehydrogenase/reductase SDR [Pterulicium gracile]|uniref:Short-chain dehydrogenase/reductase SDR n=1 Tax=Pterulicium gracile TaxID=1884261 RepID=A0A5C3Q7N5_9AGAR|nr:short-chain dehydrogenase/reductase SDR [Pterula gracilis]
MSELKPLIVVAGVGNGSGTGGSTARLFAKNGYSVALIARGADSLKKITDEINSSEGDAAPFAIEAYNAANVSAVFVKIFEKFPAQTHTLRIALWNVAEGVFKNFLSITPEEVSTTFSSSVAPAFAFSREVILKFKENDIVDGTRGTLLFTGATASVRGNVLTSLFSAGKHAERALSQSLAKEFGRQNIHVVHAIIDGPILTDNQRNRNTKEWEKNEDIRLDPDAIALAYQYVVGQHRSAWTWELDLRPAHEKW